MTNSLKNSRYKYLLILVVAVVIAMLSCAYASAASVNNATGNVNSKSGAYIRKSTSTSSSKVLLAKDNSKLTIKKVVFTSKTSTSSKYKWYYVSYGGKSGYIRSDLVDGIKYSAVSAKVTGKVNYRAGAGTSMKKYGSLSKGAAILVYLPAKAKGSSKVWYLTKIGSKYRYVSSSYVSIIGSIFTNPSSNTSSGTTSSTSAPSTSTPTTSTPSTSTPSTSTGSGSSAPDQSAMSDADYATYLKNQGFPSDYITKLTALHKSHPKWVFIAKNTNLDFNTVLTKESKDGWSLIEGSNPISWRDKGADSFKASTGSLYSSASTSSTKLATLSNGDTVTVKSEKFDSSKNKWYYVTTAAGKTGYTKESMTSQTYNKVIEGVVNDSDVNIRVGAGTNHSVTDTANKGDKVSVVLVAKDKDGDTWYKIKSGTGYAYIYSSFVNISSTATESKTVQTVTLSPNYPVGKTTSETAYYPRCNKNYPAIGKLASGTECTILGYVTDSAAAKWYQIYKDGNIVYAKAETVSVTGTPVKNTLPSSIQGITTDDLNYRTSASTSGTVKGTFASGAAVTVTGITVTNGTPWYKVKVGSSYYYAISTYINIIPQKAPTDAAPSVTTTVTNTGTVAAKPDSLTGKAVVSLSSGTYIAKDGSNWFNASDETIAYFLDPRNFLNDTRIYMFEDLSYNSSYHTLQVVGKVLSGTQLPTYGFTANIFLNAGAQYKISPVHLAARARQETGGGSHAIYGCTHYGSKVYNPFNIGAYSGSNPVETGMKYAYNQGWTTQTKAVNGGAKFLAAGYINAGQNSMYFQKWNVGNGDSAVATHQYMTNIMAPYYEASTTKSSYSSFGISEESLTFIIPVYKNMPAQTALPN